MEKIINTSISNWVNNNRELLLKHKGKWIAFNESGLIAVHDSLAELRVLADSIAAKYAVYFVNPTSFGRMSFRPIHFRSVFFHEWTPLVYVELGFKDKKIELPMLVDSGADGSLIDFQTGVGLGLQLAEGELQNEAKGIGGGKISYVWRNLHLTIEGNSITAPFAWVLEGQNQENIIGRQVVFDAWDIEFKQAEEKILFKFRGQPTL